MAHRSFHINVLISLYWCIQHPQKMDRIKSGAEWLMNNKKAIGYVFIALFFAVLAQQLYNRYIKSSNNASYYEGYSNAPSSGASEPPVATIRMFKVDWCPHCKKAAPEFQKVEEKYNGKVVNGHKLNFVVVDGEDPANESLVNQHNVQGYPTIVLTKDGKNIEYDAKVDQPTLEKFINTMV
jgi:thiol-disulfide isomerase/thioredoxin